MAFKPFFVPTRSRGAVYDLSTKGIRLPLSYSNRKLLIDYSTAEYFGKLSSLTGRRSIGDPIEIRDSERFLSHAMKQMEKDMASFIGDGVLLHYKYKACLTFPIGLSTDFSMPHLQLTKRYSKNKKYPKGDIMSNNTLVHADDAISTRFFAQWLSERYPFSLDKFVAIQEPTISKIIEDMRFEKTLKLGGGYTNYLAMNNEALIIITQREVEGEKERSEVYFEVFAKDIDTYYRYFNYVMEQDEASRLDTMVVEYHSIYLDQYKQVKSNVEYFETSIFEEVIDDFYAPYLDTDLLFEQFMQSRSAMLQLTGKPGIGKSKLIALFIKYLIEHDEHRSSQENVLKIARPANSDILAEEEFWVKLRQEGFQALILDDVDHILQKRNDHIDTEMEKLHNEIVRKILTFTDGLSSQKSKILISTNLEYHRIDKALIRDFRLFDSIELRPLNKKEAKKIWQQTYNLDEEIFDSTFKNEEEITAAKLSKEIESRIRLDKNGGNEEERSYLKEDGISKVKKLRERRDRVGLV